MLREVQIRTHIRDKYALATILGNIKQESNSIPTFAREALEFLITVAIAVGMESSSGLLRTVMLG